MIQVRDLSRENEQIQCLQMSLTSSAKRSQRVALQGTRISGKQLSHLIPFICVLRAAFKTTFITVTNGIYRLLVSEIQSTHEAEASAMKRSIDLVEDICAEMRPTKRLSMLHNTPKQWKEQRKTILKMSKFKLKEIGSDIEGNLLKSVLVNNTYRKMRRELREQCPYSTNPGFAAYTSVQASAELRLPALKARSGYISMAKESLQAMQAASADVAPVVNITASVQPADATVEDVDVMTCDSDDDADVSSNDISDVKPDTSSEEATLTAADDVNADAPMTSPVENNPDSDVSDDAAAMETDVNDFDVNNDDEPIDYCTKARASVSVDGEAPTLCEKTSVDISVSASRPRQDVETNVCGNEGEPSAQGYCYNSDIDRRLSGDGSELLNPESSSSVQLMAQPMTSPSLDQSTVAFLASNNTCDTLADFSLCADDYSLPKDGASTVHYSPPPLGQHGVFPYAACSNATADYQTPHFLGSSSGSNKDVDALSTMTQTFESHDSIASSHADADAALDELQLGLADYAGIDLSCSGVAAGAAAIATTAGSQQPLPDSTTATAAVATLNSPPNNHPETSFYEQSTNNGLTSSPAVSSLDAHLTSLGCDNDVNSHIWACFQHFNMAIACS